MHPENPVHLGKKKNYNQNLYSPPLQLQRVQPIRVTTVDASLIFHTAHKVNEKSYLKVLCKMNKNLEKKRRTINTYRTVANRKIPKILK